MSLFRRSRDEVSPVADAVARERLMDAAVTVIGRDAGAPLGAVARRAGIEESQASRLFPTRHALIEATVVRGAARLAGASFLDDGEPLMQVAMLIGRVWQDQAPVLPLTRMGARGPYRRAVEKALAPLRATLREAISHAAERHEVRSDISPAAISWLVEQAAIDVVEAADAEALGGADGLQLVMTHALCAAGLGWREATDLAIDARARLATGAPPAATPPAATPPHASLPGATAPGATAPLSGHTPTDAPAEEA